MLRRLYCSALHISKLSTIDSASTSHPLATFPAMPDYPVARCTCQGALVEFRKLVCLLLRVNKILIMLPAHHVSAWQTTRAGAATRTDGDASRVGERRRRWCSLAGLGWLLLAAAAPKMGVFHLMDHWGSSGPSRPEPRRGAEPLLPQQRLRVPQPGRCGEAPPPARRVSGGRCAEMQRLTRADLPLLAIEIGCTKCQGC